MNKNFKFILLTILYTIALYLAYNVTMTTYAYILVISITWIVIIQVLDKELSNSEKIISSLFILLAAILAILGKIGIINSIMGVVGILLTEMIYYILITETTEIHIPKTLRTVVLLVCSTILAFLIENISTKLLSMTSQFFVQDSSITDYISRQYAISILIYNLGYSVPLYLSILFVAYALKSENVDNTNFYDLRFIIIIVLIPLFAFTYNNIISDQYIEAGKNFKNALNSYEEYITPNQYATALDSVNIGNVKYDAKDNISYYNDNYFYEAPYSIECIIYNYRQQMNQYVNTNKARYTKKEIDNIRSLTETNLTYIQYAIESCKSNSVYMWIIYIINSLVVLCSYLTYRNSDKNTQIQIITRK